VELIALFGALVVFGGMLKMARYSANYYNDERLNSMRELAKVKSSGACDDRETKKLIEKIRWDITLNE
jgi:hypothetical protein